ncbi:MAG: hypothetical protein KC591_07520, partial [Gemmatimonadetes bacterium]|nr:hypothetical protein [Gemmatimonadota bacterium]
MNLRRFRRRSGSLLLAAGAFLVGAGLAASTAASEDDLAAHLAARYDRVLLAPEDRPLRNPSAVSVDPFGGIFVADTDNHRVLQYDAAGRFTFALGGYGWESGRLSQPTDVCAREGFRVFVADAGNDRVQSFSIRDSAEEGTVFPFSFGSGFGGEPLVR